MKDWLIPLLVVFGIYIPLSTTAPSPERQSSAQPQSPAFIQVSPTVTPTQTPGPGRVPGEAARLLCDFFGLQPQLGAGLNPQQKSEVENWRGDYCRITSALSSNASKLGYGEVEYLIATVPDPIDTRLDHQFDRALDAIQRAIGSAGYLFDRYWLPWDRSKTAAPAISPSDPKTAQIATRQLRDPGVILFRGLETEKTETKRLLLLFLVGETPTGGIHKTAFQSALQQIDKLSQRVGSKNEKSANEKLRILTPYFPGSADSLAILLKGSISELKPQPEVSIITGSTGTVDKVDYQKNFAQVKGGFQDTVVDASQTTEKFYDYLRDHDPQIKSDGQNRPYIAVLSESGTARGQIVRKMIMELPILSLTYPVHISQLRAEESKRSLRKDVTTAPAVKDADMPLPMSEAGSPAAKDIPPLFSSLEPVTMERTLREILTAIHRERIRYVRVSATDLQDRIFLVHEIRKHCPNVTIFMTNDDLLYLHSDYNLDFRGALVISSYPLFALNQYWTFPFEGYKERLQFPTPAEHGIYNATLALLDRKELMLEYGLPFEEYKDGGSRYPALWLGIVGRNGVWPVTAFDVSPDDKSYTMRIDTCPSSSATTRPSSSAPLPSPPTRSEVPPPSATARRSNSAHRLGLSGNYRSPIGAGFLLMLGSFCLFLSLILLVQLSLVRRLSRTDQADHDRLRPFARIRAWMGRRWFGRVFGDEEFYYYHRDRRISLMGCCVSLLTVSLFTSGVAILPALVLWKEKGCGALLEDWERHGVVGVVACTILALTLGAFIWLMVMWIISVCRNFGGRLWAMLALVAGMAMFPFVDWRLSLGLSILLIVSVILWIISVWGNFDRILWESVALVVVLAMIWFAGRGLYEVLFVFNKPEKVFFFLRASELTSLVSVLLPALLVGLAAFLAFFAALRRWNLAERMPCLCNPRPLPDDAKQFLRFDHEGAKSFNGLKDLEDRVQKMIVCPIFRLPGVTPLTILILVGYGYFFVRQFIPSVDGLHFDWFFKLAFGAVPLMLVWMMIRFFWLWKAVRRLLRRLWWHPLISQYAARRSEEKSFALLPPIDLMAPTPTYTALSFSVLQARSFFNALKPGSRQAKERTQIKPLVEKAESELSQALESDARGDWQNALQRSRCSQDAVAELSKRVAGMLEDSWRAAGPGGAAATWRDEGKFFLITHVVAFLQYVFAHLQNLISLVTIGLLLMLLAANFYPFQPHEPLLLFSWVAILTSVVVTMYILFSANRDKTLSLLARTAPGKVNITRDLVFRVLFHGVIPVVALLGIQFPEAVRQIFSWLNVFGGKGS